MTADAEVFTFAGYGLDLARGRLTGPDGDVALRAKSFELLAYLVRNAGRVISKDELLDAVWPDVIVTEDSLTQSVHDIRRALGDSGAALLRTIPRRGYVFTGLEPPASARDERPAQEVRPRRIARRAWTAAAALAGVLAVAAFFLWPGPAALRGSKASIAVLPFDTIGEDAFTGRLAQGITQDIVTDLARFREFDVISHNSTAALGPAEDIAGIGRRLDVRYVLTGSIQHDGDRLRIAAQLVDAATGAHVWTDRWDRAARDVFEVQTELSQRVTAKLSGVAGMIVTADREAARRKRPTDLNAYDLYLIALEAKQRETRESIAECFALLGRALEMDAAFARAWALLGHCHAFSMRWAESWDAAYARYLDAERRAVELDPLDADAHAGFAMALALGGDLKQGEAEFDKALGLNPNSADVLTRFAYWAVSFGRAGEGAEAATRAVRLDPGAPPWALRFQSAGLAYGKRYAEAIRVRQKVPKAMFTDSDYIELAGFLVDAGRIGEARALAAEAVAVLPGISIEGWTGDPGWLEADRERAVAQMRAAAFPACAGEAELARGAVKVRLPECAGTVGKTTAADERS